MSVTFLEKAYTFARDLHVNGAIFARGGTTLIQGNTHDVSGNIVAINGVSNTVHADNATALGDHLQVRNDSMTVVGSYNFEDDAIFVVGNGTDENNRSDALVVAADGSVYLDAIVFQQSSTSISATEDSLELDGDVLISGNVGIKTANPEHALDVNGTVRVGGMNSNGHVLPSLNAEFDVGNDALQWRNLRVSGNVSAGVYTGVGYGNVEISAASPSIISFTVDGDEKMRMDPSGDVGIATKTPAERLHVIGNIVATGDILSSFSDARLKGDVRVIPEASQKIQQLKGVLYRYNATAREHGFASADEHVGVIAQDVEMVLPQAVRLAPFDTLEPRVSKSGNNYLTVQYDKLIPLLIEAVKEQGRVIETQAERMTYVIGELDALKSKI